MAVVLHVFQNHAVAGESHSVKHALALRHHFFPVAISRLVDVSHHQTVTRCVSIGKDIHLAVNGLHGIIDIVCIGAHLYELRVGLLQVADEEVIAVRHTSLGQVHYRFVAVDAYAIEAQRLRGVLIEEAVFALRCADLVVINLLHRVLSRCFLSLLRSIVCAIIESVAQPFSARKLRPDNMVVKHLARLTVLHVNLLPVRTVTRNHVSHIASVM